MFRHRLDDGRPECPAPHADHYGVVDTGRGIDRRVDGPDAERRRGRLPAGRCIAVADRRPLALDYFDRENPDGHRLGHAGGSTV